MGRLGLALAITLLLTALTSLVRGAHEPTPPEMLAERIREEIASGGPRADRALAALRELRDPALKPLFSQLAAGPKPEQRWHGALGRAELESPPTLDPFLLAKLPTAAEQLAVVDAAWREGLLTIDGVKDLLARNDLDAAVEVFLRLAAASAGEATSTERAAELLASAPERSLTAVRAGLLTLAAGGEPAPALPESMSSLVAGADTASQSLLEAALDDVARLRIRGALPLADAALAQRGADPRVRAAAIRAIMTLEPQRAQSPWLSAFDDPDYGLADRLRLALIAIESPGAPETVLRRLQGSEDPLLSGMGEAALGLRAGDTDAAVRLIGQRYQLAMAWLVQSTGSMESADAELILLAMIDLARDVPTASWEVTEQIIRAAEALAGRHAERFVERMRQAAAAGDARTEQVMLLGALRPAGAAVCGVALDAASDDAECRALALIAAGRATEGASTPDLVDRLRAVAGGEGALHAARRVQAAWLALRLTGDERLALARILAPEPS